MARSLKLPDIDNYNGSQVPGYYQRISLDDIINQFIVAYVGKDKVISSVPRHEVAFWAQRSLQEFSYDVLHQDKSVEIELGPTRTFQLPPDYVNYVKITKVDEGGNNRVLQPARLTKASKGALQDDQYDYVYDEAGNIIFAEQSESTNRFRENDITVEATNFYNGFFYGDDFSYYSQYYKRFGLNPQVNNFNGHYLLDNENGVIYFDDSIKQDDLITLYYISDGLANNDDLTNVYVPKMAEDAMYASILYNLSKLRPSAAGAAALYKKEAMAKLRNAKIRLSNWKHEEVAQVLRNKSKWIKH